MIDLGELFYEGLSGLSLQQRNAERRARRARLFIEMHGRVRVQGEILAERFPVLVSRVTGIVYARGVPVYTFYDLADVEALDPAMTGQSFADLVIDFYLT